MFNKVQLLLSLSAPEKRDELIERLVMEAATAQEQLPPGSRHRRAVRVPGDPTATVPQDGQTGRTTPTPQFEVFFELGGPDIPLPSLVSAVAGLGDRLGSTINPAQSAALVGTEHVIVPGSHPLLLVMALYRLPQWTRQQFHDFWRNDHAEEVNESVADLQGYRQFHADETATRDAAAAAGLRIDDLEGSAEGYYQDLDVFLEIMARPEVAADAGFIDHSRSVMWLYELAAD
jgi:hypothetical protein